MKVISLPKENQISRESLIDLYVHQRKSVAQIALLKKCSNNKIDYWLAKHGIKKRSISDALYQLKNPSGDPFSIREPRTLEEGILFGMGIGLYWGEGSKRGNGGVRVTNSDPKLIRKFIEFLETIYGIEKAKLRFSVQIFDDISPKKALRFWKDELKVSESQFYKVVVSKIRGKGTYRYKSENGVIIVYFNNIKLKKIICQTIEKIR